MTPATCRKKRRGAARALLASLPCFVAAAAHAQDMSGMAMPHAGHPANGQHTMADGTVMAGHDMGATAEPIRYGAAHAGDMAGMRHVAGMDMSSGSMMARYYPMNRESSGTSWQPDSAPMRGAMYQLGGWSLMAEGFATGIYDRQGGPRGDSYAFSTSMGMLMATRDVSPADRIGLRGMISLDPAMGRRGYPLLFATGETADGVEHLVDRQHPHDFLMELAATWAHQLGPRTAFSLYAGLPGEPALGPPAFMHRASGQDIPEAPLGHHWFDSTHITFGVVTAGLSHGPFRLEASAFKGREPDQRRWNMETPRLDSWSVRAFWNPTSTLSLQASTGRLHSPEQIEPDHDEHRTTASASWTLPLGPGRSLAATAAWSNKNITPGPALTGLLAEATLRLQRHELFARIDHEEQSELFDDDHDHGIFRVTKLSVGYQHEVPVANHLFLAVGGLASAYRYPDTLVASYGRRGFKSFMLYGRLRFGS